MYNVPAVHALLRRAYAFPPNEPIPEADFIALFKEAASLLAQVPEIITPDVAREATAIVTLLSKWCAFPTLITTLSNACGCGKSLRSSSGSPITTSSINKVPSPKLDPYEVASAFHDAVRVETFLNSSASMIQVLDRALRIFDPKDDWRALIMDHPETPGEDTDDILGMEVPRGTQIALKRANEVVAVARVGQALSGAMYGAGNPRQALHIILCSINIYERIRASVAVPNDARIGEQELRELYASATEESMRLGESDLAVELGSKLVTIHEVAIAEAVMESRDEATAVVPHGHVDPFGHFKAQEQLGRALGRFGDADGSFNAHRRALELLEVEWPFEEEKTTASFVPPPFIRKSLHSNMMTCSRLLDHPIHESVGHARLAVAVLREMDSAELQEHANPNDARMLLAAGTITYLYALELAGGVAHASSPPVAVLHLKRRGVPEIVELLDEATGYLEDALSRAELGNVEGGKSCIALQLAVLRVERRQEDRCRRLLDMFHINRDTLEDLDAIRRAVATQTRTGPVHPSMHAFIETVYTPAVFARLIPLAHDPRPTTSPSPPPHSSYTNSSLSSSSSPSTNNSPSTASTPKSGSALNVFSFATLTRKLTLSRHRRPSVLRVTCDVCCMSSNGGEVRCDVCSNQGKVLHFCDEECLGAHFVQCHPAVGTLGRQNSGLSGAASPPGTMGREHRRGLSVGGGGWR